MLKKYFSLLIIVLFSAYSATALTDSIPERPDPPRLVNNLSQKMPGFLSAQEEAKLEKKLEDFANQTSNQIVIVITDHTGGLEAWDYATRLGQKWGVGHKKEDNGTIILVKPGGDKAYISVGYGLEGAIPDLTAKRIVDEELLPAFAKGNV